MFDKVKFAEIIKRISETYNNQRDFSSFSGINRTYLSKYMNMKLDEPPKPKILEKLANASNGITTYSELMLICDYLDYEFHDLMRDKTKLYDNPYSVNLKYNQVETFIFNILYSYENIDRLDFNENEILQINQIYNYIKNNLTYCKLIDEYEKLKAEYLKRKEVNIDEADIAFASGVKALNDTNKMIIQNTLEALLAKQEKDTKEDK